MRRQVVLTTGTTLISAAIAGCLTEMVGSNTTDNVILDPPDNGHANGSDFAYPTYGDPFPAFELTDPLAETTVDTGTIDDERLICTGFFATCPAKLYPAAERHRRRSERAVEQGIDDAVRFLAITFGPERNTPDELRDHAEMVNVDLDLENWHYLRPDDATEAKSIVNDALRILFEREGEDPTVEFAHTTARSSSTPTGTSSGATEANIWMSIKSVRT